MNLPTDPIAEVQRHVVVFDICSSTIILEDLKQTDNLREWRNLLMRMQAHLFSPERNFETYKFLGDGWIILGSYVAERG
jgi:hypothetical protein